jgi:hypothetical protein
MRRKRRQEEKRLWIAERRITGLRIDKTSASFFNPHSAIHNPQSFHLSPVAL